MQDSRITSRAMLEDRPLARARRAGREGHEDGEPGNGRSGEGFWAGFRRPGPWHAAILAIALVAAGIGGLFAWRWAHRPASRAVGLVIAGVRNNSGVPQFEPSLEAALHLDFEQSPWFDMVSQSKTGQAGAGVSGESAATRRDVCGNAVAETYLTGEVHRLSHGYLLTLEAFACDGGQSVGVSRGIADTADGVVAVLDRVVWDMRRQLGESAASVAQYSRPLFGNRANSLTALKAYADGDRLVNAGKLRDAVAPLQHALEIDPEFALAAADLGQVYADLGERDLSVQALTRAFELRSTVDDRTRLFIAATYTSLVTGDLQAGIHNYKDWTAEYPNSATPLVKLAGLEIEAGEPAQALDLAQRALDLDPGNSEAYLALAQAQMHLNQFERATDTCHLAITRHVDGVEVHAFLLQTAFLRLDQTGVDEQIAWARGTDSEPEMQWQQALMNFAQGKARAGTALANAAAQGFRSREQDARASQLLAAVARIQAELGMIDAAGSTLSQITDADTYADALVAMAHAGAITRASQGLKVELDAHSTSTLWREDRGPQVRAAIALNGQRPSEAIDALTPAKPFELSGFGVPALRGRAYLMAHQPEEAQAEFNKILEHSGVEPLSHDYPLAQLGLARADVQAGRTDAARLAYGLLLQIWKDADTDLPRLREAKSEYARVPGEHVQSVPATPARDGKEPAPAHR